MPDQADPFIPHVPNSGHSNGANGADQAVNALGDVIHAATALGDEAAALGLDIRPRSFVQARQRFRLEYTGSDALVRRVPLARLVTMSSISPTMQPIVLEVFGAITGNDDTLSTATTLDLLRKNDALVDGVCLLGFIKPRLVATQEEADAANDPYVWCIDEVDPRDRQAYFDLVTGPEAEAAKVLEPFPASRLEDSPDHESGAAAEPTEPATEAPAGDDPRPVELSVI